VSGVKHDDGKPRFDLIPPTALEEVAHVFTFGASKYSPGNWAKVPDYRSRYLAAAYRHINAYHQGKILDDESGYTHLAHAAACLLILEARDEKA